MYASLVSLHHWRLLTNSQRLAGDYATFDAHVDGVRRIVAARGGLDNLGWHGFIKTAIGGSEQYLDDKFVF